jgi:hypothetical protein
MDVQTTICQCATGTCNHQQRPLLTFSDLPPELRQKIYSLAIISPPLIRVEVPNSIADPELEAISFKFRELVRRSESRNISLLLVCKESNAVYKKICYAYLPARRRSIIRFDPTTTTIFITNFLAFIRDPDLAYGIEKGWRRQQWVREIRKIGAPNSCFEFMYVHYNSGGVGLSVKDLGQLFEMFENLEECVSFHDHPHYFPEAAVQPRPCHELLGHSRAEIDFDVYNASLAFSVRVLFEEYRDKYNASFKVPRIEVKAHHCQSDRERQIL